MYKRDIKGYEMGEHLSMHAWWFNNWPGALKTKSERTSVPESKLYWWSPNPSSGCHKSL